MELCLDCVWNGPILMNSHNLKITAMQGNVLNPKSKPQAPSPKPLRKEMNFNNATYDVLWRVPDSGLGSTGVPCCAITDASCKRPEAWA